MSKQQIYPPSHPNFVPPEGTWDSVSGKLVKFNTMPLPHLKLKQHPAHLYTVYSAPQDYKQIEACTVIKALEETEISSPHKIIHTGNRMDIILHNGSLEQRGSLETGCQLPIEPKAAEAAPEAVKPGVKAKHKAEAPKAEADPAVAEVKSEASVVEAEPKAE